MKALFLLSPPLPTPKRIGQAMLEEGMNLRYRGRTQSDRRNLLPCPVERKLTPSFACNGLCHQSKVPDEFLFTSPLFCGEVYLSCLPRS